MDNLTDTLPELMRRATEDLEPESTDLVERGMRHGVRLRRRRRALLSAAGTAAVLVTATAVAGGPYLLGGQAGADPGVASVPAATVAKPAKPTKPAKPAAPPAAAKETLTTLRRLLPANLQIIRPGLSQEKATGIVDVMMLVDDGKGVGELSVRLGTMHVPRNCADKPEPGHCRIRSDGSVVTVSLPRADKHDPSGLVGNSVVILHRDGTGIVLGNSNASSPQDQSPNRPQPVFSVAQLTQLADSSLWRYPPEPAGR